MRASDRLRRTACGLVVALAACSGGSDAAEPTLPTSAAPAVAETAPDATVSLDTVPPDTVPVPTPESAEPRVFTDARGRTVELPHQPERVLALSEPTLDGMLALGITPVGTSAGRGQSGVSYYLASYLATHGDGSAAEIPIVAALAAPNLELIAAADPDLILVDGTSINDDTTLARMSEIAPTVWLSAPGDDWKVAFTVLGEALGVAERAAEVLAAYAARVETIGAALGPNAGATVSIVRWGLAAPALILKELPASRVVADLGLTRPPEQDREGLGHSEPVSLERLDVIDADWMFFGALGTVNGPTNDQVGVAASEEALARAVETPGFVNLAAYQNGRVIPVDGSVWTSAGGPISVDLVLDDIEAALTVP